MSRVRAPDDDARWRVDHLSLTQPWHQFDEAVLFHRAVLGLRPQESVDVADPTACCAAAPSPPTTAPSASC